MNNHSSSIDQCIRHSSLSDVGMRRKNNQDSMNSLVSADAAYWNRRGHLFLVADGMGAHAAGELASKLAADGIPHSYSKDMDAEPAAALCQAIVDANKNIYEKGMADAEFQGMGTTCSALLLLPQGAIAGHVGDSRIYRFRRGRLEQLTFDHSLVWEMQAAGQISPEAAEVHLPKNIITRSLGPGPRVQVDLEGPFPIETGDVYLLCSDGLTGPVSDQEIGAIISCLPPDEATQTLVDLANLRGGPDNITVIVIQVDGPPVASDAVEPEEPQKRRVHPILWWIAAVCLVAGIVMFLLNAIIPAVLCGIGAIVVGIVGLIRKFDSDDPQSTAPQSTSVLGRGPHRNFDCSPSAAMASQLSHVVVEIRQTAAQMEVEIDWPTFDEMDRKAQDALDAGDFFEGIRQRCRGLSFVVAELKDQKQRRAASDSHVDLI